MIVWVSGPTGSGKTTLAASMADSGYAVVREAIPGPLFEAFKREPTRNCADLQEAIMRARAVGWSRVAGLADVVFDRSADEDVAVFCRLHAERGLVGGDDMRRLEAVAAEVRAVLPEPDLVVYMRPSAAVLTARIAGHPAAIRDTLSRQVELYDEWAAGRGGDLVRLDNGGCAPGAMPGLFGSLRRC